MYNFISRSMRKYLRADLKKIKKTKCRGIGFNLHFPKKSGRGTEKSCLKIGQVETVFE